MEDRNMVHLSRTDFEEHYCAANVKLKRAFDISILGSEMIDNLSIKTNMFDFEERALIGWLAITVREPANQDAYFKVQNFCFYDKVVYHFRPEYTNQNMIMILQSKDVTLKSKWIICQYWDIL